MGVAFESTIMSFNTADPTDCDEESGCSHSDSAIGQAIDLARQNGARVINISLGGDGVGNEVLTAANLAAQAGIVVVISAGNEGDLDPSRFAVDTAHQAGAGHVIIAGALGVPLDGNPAAGTDTSKLAGFSNRAGTGAQYYLAALGYRVRSFDQNGTAYLYNGTSFSAPVISGAAALLAQAFPNLSGSQIVEILFNTADDLGEPGVDATYGNGRLNIARAFQPQGTTKAAGSEVPLSTSDNGSTSAAMGDASGQSFGAIILDGYSRAYVLDLAQTLSRAPQERPLSTALQPDLSTSRSSAGPTTVAITVRENHSGQGEVSMAQIGLTYEDSHQARAIAGHVISQITPETAIALGISESGRTLQKRLGDDRSTSFLIARDPYNRAGFNADAASAFALRQKVGLVNITMTSEQGAVDLNDPLRQRVYAGDRPNYALSSLGFDRRIHAAGLRLGISRLREDETVLGGRFSFAPAGSTSWFLDGSGTYNFGSGFSAEAQYRLGWTLMPGGNGLVEGGQLESDGWAFDLMKSGAFASNDRLAFRIMQPLRVRSGGYSVNLPASFDYSNGSTSYRRSELSLSPTGREINVEASYGIGLFAGAGWLSANTFFRSEPGHIEEGPDDVGAAVRFNLSF
jgi:hypothetical protein